MNSIQGANATYRITKDQPHKKGKFGGITIYQSIEDNSLVSVKKISKSDFLDRIDLKDIIHPNLSETIEYVENNEGLFLIRRYYHGTDLKTIIKKRIKYNKLDSSFFIKAFAHILNGLSILHQHHIIHRDIKPSNIIFKHAPNASVKIWRPEDVILTDFEQAAIYPIKNRIRIPFALIYSPPEQLLNHNKLVSPASDLFALAISLYEAVAKKPPYEDCNAEILLNLQLTYPLKKPTKMDESLFEILKKAAYKEPFPLPPKRLAPNVITEILERGISKRYKKSEEFRTALNEYLKKLPLETTKKSFYTKFFK